MLDGSTQQMKVELSITALPGQLRTPEVSEAIRGGDQHAHRRCRLRSDVVHVRVEGTDIICLWRMIKMTAYPVLALSCENVSKCWPQRP